MEGDEIVKISAAVSAGIVAIVTACYAGARMSLCRKVFCKSCCCELEVEREVPPQNKV